MGQEYLIDTNSIIEFLGGSLPNSANEWIQSLIEQNNYCISVINKIEVLGFNASENDLKILEEFIDSSTIIGLSEEIISQTIELRRTRKTKLPDAIIAATAIFHDLTIITRNTKDFEKIREITTINPHIK